MTEIPEISGALRAALDEIRAIADIAPSAGAVAAGRGAMHRALAARPRRAAWLRTLRLAALPAGALVALASVGVSAASAPPSSPLHGARNVEEQVRFRLASADRARLALEFARAHLHDAQHASGSKQSVGEAEQWVDQARQSVDGDHGMRQDVEEVSSQVEHEAQTEGGSDHPAGAGHGVKGAPGAEPTNAQGGGQSSAARGSQLAPRATGAIETWTPGSMDNGDVGRSSASGHNGSDAGIPHQDQP